jgi:hypothetical protein
MRNDLYSIVVLPMQKFITPVSFLTNCLLVLQFTPIHSAWLDVIGEPKI